MSEPAPGETIELCIDRLAAGGAGVGRYAGRVVFVPWSAPGDRLRVKLRSSHRRHLRGDLVQILKPGPSRRAPSCPYFGRCGGCTWLHLDEREQVAARRELLIQALRRIGGRSDLPEVRLLESPRATEYRARARIAYADGRVGFRSRGSHRVVDIERCAVLEPETQRALETLRAHPPSGAGEIEIRGFQERAAGLRVGPGSFFQANALLWDRWAVAVEKACGRGRWAVELYAGAGFYTVRIQQAFGRVDAVEPARAARELRRNTHACVHGTTAEAFLEAAPTEPIPDVVLLNPPRGGCTPAVIDALSQWSPPRIVYVSCDPATLARDLGRLGSEYRITDLLLIDALPQTHHVEAMVTLDRTDLPGSRKAPLDDPRERS